MGALDTNDKVLVYQMTSFSGSTRNHLMSPFGGKADIAIDTRNVR
jgi:hypothetical protein